MCPSLLSLISALLDSLGTLSFRQAMDFHPFAAIYCWVFHFRYCICSLQCTARVFFFFQAVFSLTFILAHNLCITICAIIPGSESMLGLRFSLFTCMYKKFQLDYLKVFCASWMGQLVENKSWMALSRLSRFTPRSSAQTTFKGLQSFKVFHSLSFNLESLPNL